MYYNLIQSIVLKRRSLHGMTFDLHIEAFTVASQNLHWVNCNYMLYSVQKDACLKVIPTYGTAFETYEFKGILYRDKFSWQYHCLNFWYMLATWSWEFKLVLHSRKESGNLGIRHLHVLRPWYNALGRFWIDFTSSQAMWQPHMPCSLLVNTNACMALKSDMTECSICSLNS